MTEPNDILQVIFDFVGPLNRGRMLRMTASYIALEVGEKNMPPGIVNDMLKLALAFENRREDEIKTLGTAIVHKINGTEPSFLAEDFEVTLSLEADNSRLQDLFNDE